MTEATRTVTVRVPATTANLGPGFDTLGLALSLYDELTVTALDAPGLEITVEGVGADDVPRDASNLVVSSIAYVYKAVGQPMPGLRLHAVNAIPHGRGLGSSGAAVVSGIVAARGLLEGIVDISPADLLRIATEIEGHPDNVAPSLFGGLTIAWLDEQGPSVPHEDAIFNVSRSALLIAALTQSPELMLAATEDKLHQNYRAAAMPETDALVRMLRAEGFAAVVSGAGPSVLVLADGPGRRAVAAELVERHATSPWRALMLAVDVKGATVKD